MPDRHPSPTNLGAIAPARAELARVLSNGGWMIGEQIFRIAAGLYTSILIARHLGADEWGALSYAIAYSGLFAVVATAGLNRILVRELSKHENEPATCEQLIHTVFVIRLSAAALVYALGLGIAVMARQPHLLLVAIVSGAFFFSAADVIDLLYQARSQSRRAIVVRLTTIGATTLLRTILVWNGAGVVMFAAVSTLEGALIAFGLLLLYRDGRLLLRRSQLNVPLAKRLLHESWPEILAGLSSLIFIRIDQVMLANMIDTTAVGVYSIAVRLSESWYFIPAAVVASTFPGIVRLREVDTTAYVHRIEQLMRSVAALSYVAVLFTWLFGRPIVVFLFGNEYATAADILLVHMWCGLFVSLGVASGSWLMAEGRARMNLYRTALGALMNIVLNLITIPRHGAIGAAYATLTSVFIAYFLADFLFAASRTIGWLKARSLFFVPRR